MIKVVSLIEAKMLYNATNVHVINVSILAKDVKYIIIHMKILECSIICPSNCPSRVMLPSTPCVSLCLDRFGRVWFLLVMDLQA